MVDGAADRCRAGGFSAERAPVFTRRGPLRAVVAGTVKELIDAGKVRYFGLSEAGPHLAWLLTRGEHFVPIPGTRSPKRVEENVGAAVVTLTEAGLTAVDEILPHGGFGARYAGGHVPTWI